MSHERLQQLVGSSLPQLTRFRSRLVDRPWGLGPPFWTEIDRYDPSSQIHRATLQAPGGQREFADLIAHLSAGSRHHREMLWEAWSIDGLSGGRWALAVRLSPVLSERGVGAAAIWSRLLRSDPHHDGSDDQPRQPSPGKPAVGELVAEVISELLEFQFKGVYLVAETVSGLLRAVRWAAGRDASCRRTRFGAAGGVIDAWSRSTQCVQRAPDRSPGRRVRLDLASRSGGGQHRVRRRRHECVAGRVHSVDACLATALRRRARRSPGDVDAARAIRRRARRRSRFADRGPNPHPGAARRSHRDTYQPSHCYRADEYRTFSR